MGDFIMRTDNDESLSLSTERIAYLLNPDLSFEREDITHDDIMKQSQAIADDILRKIENLIYLRALNSRFFADFIWQHIEDNISSGNKVSMGHRVRVKNGTLEVSYFRNAFQNEKGYYFADHVKRSGKYTYLAKDFRWASQWEKKLALSVEPYNHYNRKMFAYLSEARSKMRFMARTLKEFDEFV